MNIARPPPPKQTAVLWDDLLLLFLQGYFGEEGDSHLPVKVSL